MIVDSCLTIGSKELHSKEWQRLFKRLTFLDKNDNIVSVYRYDAEKKATVLPRGAWSMIPDKEYAISDLRSKPKMPKLEFVKQLDTHGQTGQMDAVRSMFEQEQGVVLRQPGGGKTQVALAFAAQCETRTLVLVHTNDIFDQWVEYTKAAIPGVDIGEIQGKTLRVGHITIAMAQTLKRYIRRGRQFWQQFGCLIIDEAHHSAAETWEWILMVCPAYYRFGLTATLKRADQMHPLINFLIGPVIHEQKFEAKVPVTVVPVDTGFKFNWRGPFDWARLVNELVQNSERNRAIAQIADREVKAGNSVLILSRRVEHLVRIQELMRSNRNRLLIGTYPQDDYSKSRGTKKPSSAERKQIMRDFRRGKIKCLLSTQLADEALDVPMLNRIILTHPGKAEGRIIQQVGRAVREHDSKEDAIIYDCVDDLVQPLHKQWAERKRAYNKMGNVNIKGGKIANSKSGRKLRRAVQKATRRSLVIA